MQKKLILKSPPKRILVISMRYLGDLLLTTALFKTLRENYPNATLHVLVFSNAAAMLEGNTDIDQVITTSQKPDKKEFKILCKTLFRKYDLAIATETGDRRYLYALLAAPKRLAFTPPRQEKGWWKRHFVQGWLEYDELGAHTVLSLLNLSSLLDLRPVYSLTPPHCSDAQSIKSTFSLPDKYVVIHPHPQWKYKRWPVSAWIETAQYILESGYELVFTGGPSPDELEYALEILSSLPEHVINLAGQTRLSQLTEIINQASLFIGPDTGTTHLAAATGIPVIAVYGPTNPVKWGPWPYAYRNKNNPYQAVGNQVVNNIHLIQGQADCVPCQQEGCERHRESYSACLDGLPSEKVIQACQSVFKTLTNNT